MHKSMVRYLETNLLCSLTLPIYYTYRKKNTLLGWNQVSPMHPFTRNNVKKWYDSIVLNQLVGWDKPVYDGKFTIEIDLYYPHARIDMSNVCGVAEKFMLDSIQNAGVVANDNVNNHVGTSCKIGGRDSDKPRVEVRIYKTE